MAKSGALNTSNQYIKYTIEIIENSQNVANNTSNVTIKVRFYRTNTGYTTYGTGTLYYKVDGKQDSYPITSSQKITENGITLLNATYPNLEHNADGTKTLTVSAWIDHSAVTSEEQSYSQTLTTIPRASSLTASNGTLNTEQTLTISRASSSFTHTISYECGTASGTIVTKTTETSVKWTPPLSLASQNTTGTSVSVTLTIVTYNGSTNIGTKTKTITCTIPASVKPSCAVAVSDPNGYATTYGGYIQGLSKFKVVVTATTSYGSAIASYSTSANDTTYTSSSFTTGVVKTSGTNTITSEVTDKRGRSGTKSVTATVLAYSKPKITKLSVGRCDQDGTDNDDGDYVKVKYSCSITSLSSKNKLTAVVNYKKTSVDTYTSKTDISASTTASYTDRTVIIADDEGSSYDIMLSITDNFDTTSQTTSVSTPFTFMHFKGEKSMGLGKLAELLDGLDVGFLTRFNKGFKFPVLKAETDLNTVLTPNFYVGEEVSVYNYTNSPITGGTFYLEVVAMGEDGRVRQRITTCSKENSTTFERFYYDSSWGSWATCFFKEEVLYNNTSGSNGTITLSKTVANYHYLEVYFMDNNGKGCEHTRIYSPNSKTAHLSVVEPSTTTTFIRRTNYVISATSMTPTTSSAGYLKVATATPSHTSGTNYIKIVRVVGRR